MIQLTPWTGQWKLPGDDLYVPRTTNTLKDKSLVAQNWREKKKEKRTKTKQNKTKVDHPLLLAWGALKYLAKVDRISCHLKFASYHIQWQEPTMTGSMCFSFNSNNVKGLILVFSGIWFIHLTSEKRENIAIFNHIHCTLMAAMCDGSGN